MIMSTGTPPHIRRSALEKTTALLSVTAVSFLLVACQSTPEPSPNQMRSLTQMAPADLQLLCADAVAQSAAVTSTKVLPISSHQLGADSYQVSLKVTGGATMNCVVNDDGQILSVETAQG